jgi:hypothetical protein
MLLAMLICCLAPPACGFLALGPHGGSHLGPPLARDGSRCDGGCSPQERGRRLSGGPGSGGGPTLRLRRLALQALRVTVHIRGREQGGEAWIDEAYTQCVGKKGAAVVLGIEGGLASSFVPTSAPAAGARILTTTANSATR